jgi:glutathione S-transferase
LHHRHRGFAGGWHIELETGERFKIFVEETMLTLWHCANARSLRALWALEELGLSYELKVLPFPPRATRKDYFEQNILGTVPLMVDGATRMTESAAIPHYLAMKHAGGRMTLPVEHDEYGAYLNWLHHGEATLTFPQTIYLRYAVFETAERRQPTVAEDYKVWFLARLRLLDRTLADGRSNLVGGCFTMADVSVGYALFLALEIGLASDLSGRLRDWAKALMSRSAFRNALTQQSKAMDDAGIPKAIILQ